MIDLILILVLVIFAYVGSKKGLIKTLFGVTSTFISILISMLLYKPVSFIISGSFIGECAGNIVNDYLVNNVPQPMQNLVMEKTAETITYS